MPARLRFQRTARRISYVSLMALSLFLGAITSTQAQTSQATIAGVVSDSLGAALPRSTITVSNLSTGIVTKVVANEAGLYSVPNLPIGEYSVSIAHPGFRGFEAKSVVLTTGHVVGINAQLKPSGDSQTVEVTSAPLEIETRTSEIGQIIESTSVSELPLGNRTSMNIIALTGGTVFIDSANYALAGGRTKSAMTWLDGGSGQNIRLGIGTAEVSPPVDTIQELGVISNNYASEFGGSASGIILQNTKSGTNKFHGTLYEFVRNDAFDASGYFATTKPELRYNVYGGTVGGPVLKDKTFFFFGFEGTQQRTGSTVILSVPTDAERTGDFSASGLPKIYDPRTQTTVNGVTTRQQFSNNIITNPDSVGLKIISYYPVATNKTATANNFTANTVAASNSKYYVGRLDHQLNSKDRLALRYIFTNSDSSNRSVYPDRGADTYQPSVSHDHIGYAQWLRTLTPSLVNDLRFTYETRVYHQLTNGVGGNYPSKLGLTGVSENAFPYISPSGYSPLGSTGQERRQYPINQYQLVDNLSKVIGRHSLKFGTELRRSMDHEINLSTASGSFSFSTLSTGVPGNTSTGNSLASLLVGAPLSFSQSQTEPLTRTSWYSVGFVQDDFTIFSRFTVNLGARWETDSPIRDENNRMNGFDATTTNPVSGTPGVVKFMGKNGFRTTPFDIDLNNFAPRLGFAWQPYKDGVTVIRGGWGYFFAHPFDAGQPASAAVGFSISGSISSPDNGVTTPFYLANGVPAINTSTTLDDSYGAVTVGSTATTAVSYFDPRHRSGYTQQFNFGVQHQLPGRFVLEITGLGSLAHKLPGQNQSINQIAPSVLSASHHAQKDRPFPQFSTVSLVAPSIGNAYYYAGIARVERRFRNGFNLNATYTFARAFDDNYGSGSTIGTDNGPYSNYYDRRADYGASSNDIRHQFIFSSVYELPFGPERRFISTGLLSHVIGAWTLGNITRAYSGAPFTVVTSTNTTAAFSSGSQRANVTGNPALASGQRSAANWFKTTAFSQPASYTFGNEGRNSNRGPNFVNLDFSLTRGVRLTPGRNLQIRGEFLNVLNHTNLKIPNSTFGSSGFGSITSAYSARQIQLGARIVF
jgi:hypothetical protein